MKRRRFFQTVAAAAPAAALLRAQQPQRPRTDGAAEDPKLDTITPAEAGDPLLRFFNAEQFAAMRRVSVLLMPPINGSLGAADCHAAEFLDFLLHESPADRQEIYRAGLDALNAQAHKTAKKPFAELDDAQAAALLAPLRQSWTYELPADPVARFLVTAKTDVRTATVNSREYSGAGTPGGGRRMGGQGLYWLPLE